MKFTGKHLVFTLLTFVALFSLLLFRSNDVRTIKDQLIRAEQSVNKLPNAKPLEQITIIQELSTLLADDIEVELNSLDTSELLKLSREEAREKALAITKISFAKLRTHIKNLRVTADSPQAEANFELSVIGAIQGTEGDFLERGQIKIALSNSSGQWLVKKVKWDRLQP